MKVTNVEAFDTPGPCDYMQDVAAHGPSMHGAYVLAMMDGHGQFGAEIAQFTCNVFDDAVNIQFPEPVRSGQLINYIGNLLLDLPAQIHAHDQFDGKLSGSTATFVVVDNGTIEALWLGDSEARWYPEAGDTVPLIYPHNRHNPKERARTVEAGGVLLKRPRINGMGHGYWWFDGKYSPGLDPLRSVADLDATFVSREPEYSDPIEIASPGKIVIASDGFWGPSLDGDIEEHIKNGTLTKEMVEALAANNEDNARALIATIV